MKELIRKAILLGLGGYHFTMEQIEGFVKELEKDGKLTPEEGRKLIDDILDKGKKQADRHTKELKKIVQSVLDETGVATKKDIADLRKQMKRK